jgi:hypothetical protein
VSSGMVLLACIQMVKFSLDPLFFTAARCFLLPLTLTPVFRAGKSFYDEVSVSMSAVNEEQACASYGLTPIISKDALGQDIEL